jgi:hypothetical protein
MVFKHLQSIKPNPYQIKLCTIAKAHKNIHKPSCHAHRRIHTIQLTATAHLLKYLFICAFKKQEFHTPNIHAKNPITKTIIGLIQVKKRLRHAKIAYQ